MTDDVLKVSELNKYIKDVLNAGFPRSLWICGEVQGYNRNKDKSHVFFELVEKEDGKSDILAKVGLVIFAGRKKQILETLQDSRNAFQLKDDIEVKFLCKIDFYPPHGVVRLIVEAIDPTYTLGRLAQEKQKLIAELKKEGVFEKNKQRPFPVVPLNIGLITSDDSAAYNDFISELKKSGYAFRVFVRNTIMQGKRAEADICDALRECDTAGGLDCVVITRGGGSLADLGCFDSRMIAEAVAQCARPVISGIGHEINLSITDMAAHTYEKTPTAVAQMLIQTVDQFLSEMDDLWESILEGADRMFKAQKETLRLASLTLQQRSHMLFREHRQTLIELSQTVTRQPLRLLKEASLRLDDAGDRLQRCCFNRVKAERRQMEHLERIVQLARPENVMRRGFTMTRKADGTVAKRVADIGEEDQLLTEFFDGSAVSRVASVKRKDGHGGNEIRESA